MSTTSEHPRIVVLGGGYAGTMAANRLSAADADVVVVNARPDFVHRIRLHQWVSGTGEAVADYGRVLAAGVRLCVDTAVRIDVAAGRVELASGESLDYDHLVYAVGSTIVGDPGIPGAAEHGFAVGEWEAAQRLRARLADSDDDGWVTVIGAGLTGVETAAELAGAGRRVRLVASGEVLAAFADRGRRYTARWLAKAGVAVFDHHRVVAVGPDTVTVIDGSGERAVVPSATTILTIGFRAPGLAADSGLTTDSLGRLVTDETLTSVDDPRIVGAGDAVAPSGVAFRMSCQAANQLGPHAADTVLAVMAGAAPQPVSVAFVGQCASLGRHSAVIQLTERDDRPKSRAISGRTGAWAKELVCRSVLWGLRMEARRPGFTPAMRGQERSALSVGADAVNR
ncbi:FAD-dependent oxidoreductase [Gordonia sp. ABSL1-1]|uniref:NAD(P)/FAD-dependent oxidoreductase n=1 Tax=Gordonia sp. ABSL1-1 TaxID=3053923 RepID=UPI00257307F4|nr:FAD-dependent oxidoreductase [Gordonia sp. ABSL1-1]MDL9937417.1 FAD-dependent oxidoreductase [Gordonia sp. ABSL1-1]